MLVMKRIHFIGYLAAALVVMLIAGCEPDDVRVSGVSLGMNELVLKTGSDTVIRATVLPDDATNQSVIWYSDNVKVATVNEGRIKALALGTARIYVETVEGAFTASCLVRVIPSYIAVESVSLDKDSLELFIGQVDTLMATVLPESATNKSVVWASSNTRAVTVQDGVVTAVGLGDAVISVTADGGLKAECTVSVVNPYIAVKHMQADRLPDMLQARADHVLFVANGQLTVAGGHVYGFTPTSSAEYLKDGEWHSLNMNYTHDMAFSVVMSDGKMMLGGGCSSGSGVGQSSNVELYDPATHTFQVLASMNHSRTLSRAVELESGNVAVSGNWYASDAIELYSKSTGSFTEVSGVSENRSTPYMFRSAKNSAIIFGPISNYGGTSNSFIVDRTDGTPFSVELFDTWKPVSVPQNWRAADCATADYSYLIMARNDADEIGIIMIEGESFSMLETELPIPTVDSDETLIYSGQVFTNKTDRIAYLPAYNGNTENPVYYILKVDYSVAPAKQTLYKTDALDAYASIWSMTMLPDGRLVACGGITNSNYTPYSTVWAFSPF